MLKMSLLFESSKYFWIFAFLIYFLLINAPLQQVFADGVKCVVVLDSSDKWEGANEQCIKSNKFDEAKFDIALNVTMEEFDFDDNCFIQCVYTKVGILTPEGLMDKKQTASVFKGNMTAEMFNKTTSIWDACIDESEKIASTKDLKNPCKKLLLHDFCFNKVIVDAGILEYNYGPNMTATITIPGNFLYHIHRWSANYLDYLSEM